MTLYRIAEETTFQMALKDILINKPIESWDVCFDVRKVLPYREDVEFTLSYRSFEKEYTEDSKLNLTDVSIDIEGKIEDSHISKLKFSYVSKEFLGDNDDYTKNESVNCVLHENEDKVGLFDKVYFILRHTKMDEENYRFRDEYVLFRSEMNSLETNRYYKYLVSKLSNAVNWDYDYDENPWEKITYKVMLNDEARIEGVINTDDDYYKLVNEQWGAITVSGFGDEVAELISDSIDGIGYEEVNRLSKHDFLIRTTKYCCVEYGHTLERVTAIVNVLTARGVESKEVDAMYCRECDEYYISEFEFELVKRYGTLCHKVLTEDEYLKVRRNFDSWSDKSILSSYGYSANEKDNLSDQERQRILAFIIENDIATTDRVLSFLEWLVRNRGGRCYMACEKWKRDIAFVRKYKPSGRYVVVDDIYRKNEIPPIG